MIILDYLRKTKQGIVALPHMHAGPMGLVPGTQVSLSLMHERTEDPSACELLLTPYTEDVNKLFRLDCYLKEGIGVVKKLVDAISAFRINIVTFESHVLNHKTEHRVAMVADWTHAKHPTFQQTPPRIQRQYESVAGRIPVNDWRYVLLYEVIMSSCGDVILFDRAREFPLPSVHLTPTRPTTLLGATRIPVKTRHRRDEGSISDKELENKTMVKSVKGNYVKIPCDQLVEIRHETGNTGNEPIPYLLSSSPSDHAIRVFFPSIASTKQIIHVAFEHSNRPGALSAIMSIIASSNLNIVTGLVRKRTQNESTFEVVLENLNTNDLPPKFEHSPPTDPDFEKLLQWCRKRISSCSSSSQLRRHNDFGTQLAIPRYPQRNYSKTIEISKFTSKVKSGKATVKSMEPFKIVERHISNLKRKNDARDINVRRSHFSHLEAVCNRVRDSRPRIFLSYPSYAAYHAKILKTAFGGEKGQFQLVDYQDPDYEDIVEEVQKQIQSCDFFIGIWHDEPSELSRISPWMPFEYGMATIAGLESMITYSKKLPPEIWKRIGPSTAREGYDDLEFERVTAPKLVKKALEKWLKDWHWPASPKLP